MVFLFSFSLSLKFIKFISQVIQWGALIATLHLHLTAHLNFCKNVASGHRLAAVLRRLNLKPASLSQSGIMSLRTLANLAYLLRVRDASDSRWVMWCMGILSITVMYIVTQISQNCELIDDHQLWCWLFHMHLWAP